MSSIGETPSLGVQEGACRRINDRRGGLLLAVLFVLSCISLELQWLSSGFNVGNVMLFTLLLALLVRGLFVPAESRLRLHFHDVGYLLYASVALLSSAWSVAPLSSVLRALPPALLWVLTLLLRSVGKRDLIKATLYVALAVGIISLLLIPIAPTTAYQPSSSTGADELRGVFKHQLRLGTFAAIATGFCFIALLNGEMKSVLFRRRFYNVVAIMFFIALLILSRTRLYFAVAALSLFLTFLLCRSGSWRFLNMSLLALAALVLFAYSDALILALEMGGFDTSLTGRTSVWQRTLGAISSDSWLLGYGYGTFDLAYFDFLFRGNYRPSHAHNSFLQAYFETGRLGQISLFLLVALQFGAAWKTGKRAYSYSLFLVIFTGLGSLFGLNYGGSLSALFCIMMLMLTLETRAEDRINEYSEASGGNPPILSGAPQ